MGLVSAVPPAKSDAELRARELLEVLAAFRGRGTTSIKASENADTDSDGSGSTDNEVAFTDSDLSLSFSSNLQDKVFYIGDAITWTLKVVNTSSSDAPSFILQESGNDPSFDRFSKYSQWLEIPSICNIVTESNSYPYANGLVCEVGGVPAKTSKSLIFVTKMLPGALTDIPSAGIPNPWFEIFTPVDGDYLVLENSFNSHNPIEDVLADSDGDGLSDFNEELVGTNPYDASSTSIRESVIDVAFLYTAAFIADISQINRPQPYIDDLTAGVNTIYGSTSDTGIQFRAVHYQQLDYKNPDPTQSWNSLTQLMAQYGTPNEGQWLVSEKIRAMSGADLVVILDGQPGEDESSGFASGTFGSRGYFANNKRRTALIHTTNFNEEESTLAHELGHVFGLAHGKRQAGDGIFAWARGYGVDNEFTTIMAYSGLYNVAPYTEATKRFSDPDSMACAGLACGVDKEDQENGADAVSALQMTRYQVEAFAPSRPRFNVTFSDSILRGATIMAGANKSGEVGFYESFNCEDDVTATSIIRLATEHVGAMGSAHALIDAGPLGAYAVNSLMDLEKISDETVSPENLKALFIQAAQGRMKKLRMVEMPQALDELNTKRGIFETANLKIYFGYTLNDSDLVVMTEMPLALEFSCS
jgi:hypothetical protein